MPFEGFEKHEAVLAIANCKSKPDFVVVISAAAPLWVKGGTLDGTDSGDPYSPHFAPASEMLERLRRREAKYVSTEGALVIRARLTGVSRREKSAYAILLRGTLFSP
jgi:hypothetical protein